MSSRSPNSRQNWKKYHGLSGSTPLHKLLSFSKLFCSLFPSGTSDESKIAPEKSVTSRGTGQRYFLFFSDVSFLFSSDVSRCDVPRNPLFAMTALVKLSVSMRIFFAA